MLVERFAAAKNLPEVAAYELSGGKVIDVVSNCGGTEKNPRLKERFFVSET